MADGPQRIAVHFDVRGADAEFVRMLRARPPVPRRRPLWRRLFRRRKR